MKGVLVMILIRTGTSRYGTRDTILALVFALVLLMGFVMAPPARAEGLMLEPSEPAVAASKVIEFTGSGFLPGERVSMWYTTPRQFVLGGGYASATSDGRISRGFAVPADAIGGTWWATAYGDESQTPVMTTFIVWGREAENAGLVAGVQPLQGAAGTTFAFAATGFDRKERVSYWITSSDGAIVDAYEREVRPNSDGRVDLTWQSPGDAMSGTYVLTVQGVKSGTARAMPFTIR
jgi:hypothetical protein